MSSGMVGPFNEGQEIRLLCEAGGGKPIPRVNWYNGTELLTGETIKSLIKKVDFNKNTQGFFQTSST